VTAAKAASGEREKEEEGEGERGRLMSGKSKTVIRDITKLEARGRVAFRRFFETSRINRKLEN